MALLFVIILAAVTYDDARVRLEAADTQRELDDSKGFVDACISRIGPKFIGGSVWVDGQLMQCRVFPQDKT